MNLCIFKSIEHNVNLNLFLIFSITFFFISKLLWSWFGFALYLNKQRIMQSFSTLLELLVMPYCSETYWLLLFSMCNSKPITTKLHQKFMGNSSIIKSQNISWILKEKNWTNEAYLSFFKGSTQCLIVRCKVSDICHRSDKNKGYLLWLTFRLQRISWRLQEPERKCTGHKHKTGSWRQQQILSSRNVNESKYSLFLS